MHCPNNIIVCKALPAEDRSTEDLLLLRLAKVSLSFNYLPNSFVVDDTIPGIRKRNGDDAINARCEGMLISQQLRSQL